MDGLAVGWFREWMVWQLDGLAVGGFSSWGVYSGFLGSLVGADGFFYPVVTDGFFYSVDNLVFFEYYVNDGLFYCM